MRKIHKLKDKIIDATNSVGRYGDGGGLYLQVSQIDDRISKSWVFRFMIDGKARTMGLGSINDFTLAQARDRARKARQLVSDGVDPISLRESERDARRSAAAKRMTFRECAAGYLRNHESTWRSAKHAALWKSTMEQYVYPSIGSLPIDDIDVTHIAKIIEPIWHDKPDTADRIRGRIESVFNWASARRVRTKENPARWKGLFKDLLPAKREVRKAKHHPAMPFDEMPAFMIELRKAEGMDARALEFTILTAVRSNETIRAKWSEINVKDESWTIPAERMKANEDHRVPLSDRAVAILESLPRVNGFVFPGSHGRHLWIDAMRVLLRKMNGQGANVHGFRSTFKDWARERTNFADDISEAALAHAIKNKVKAAYARGDLFEKRRKLMDAWARYCTNKPVSADVVPIRERA